MPEHPGQTIVTRPGRSLQLKTGTSFSIIIPLPRCIVDAHAHMENGACAPLPLLWDKSWIIRGLSRSEIDVISTEGETGLLFSLLNGEAGTVQVMSTFDIGNRAVNDNEKAFDADSLIGKSKLYRSPYEGSKTRNFHSFLVILMMDMEYGHIAGLSGQTIYHDDDSPWYYYKRSSGLLDETKGKKIPLPGENQRTFIKFEKQLTETIESAKANPLKIFPNVYTNLSCWDMDDCKQTLRELLTVVKYKHVQRKLLFGTDWYMTLVALGGKSYKSFCEDAWEAFIDIPDGEKLWLNCTFLNPFTFYGLYEKDPQTGKRKIDNIVAALKRGKHDKATIAANLSFFNRLQKEYERLIAEQNKDGGV